MSVLEKEFTYRDKFFEEDEMYEYIKKIATEENLEETLRALPFMKEHHAGQCRKKNRFTDRDVTYINHPLSIACHAYALGIHEDVILASILLHDVVEDTGVSKDDLPFNVEIKEIVGLVSFFVPKDMKKREAKKTYFERISANPKASVVKLLDRVNNVSTMAGSFSKEKLLEYIEETEEFVLPIAKKLKENAEYRNVAFAAQYQILSILETIKCMII